jgi:hypothetical protein
MSGEIALVRMIGVVAPQDLPVKSTTVGSRVKFSGIPLSPSEPRTCYCFLLPPPIFWTPGGNFYRTRNQSILSRIKVKSEGSVEVVADTPRLWAMKVEDSTIALQ